MLGLFLAKAEWQFDGFPDLNFSGTLVVLVLFLALLAIGLGCARTSPTWHRRVWVPLSSDLFPDADKPDNLATPKTGTKRPHPFSKRDKRAWMRREGSPLEIQVADAALTQAPTQAMVLNRSRGGLLLSLPQPTAVGTILSVRPPNAPDEQMWIRIQVRHCKPQKDRWYVGCKFTQELPWSVLLLFG